MTELYERYTSDPESARDYYYKEKFKADIKTKEGLQKLMNICHKYLEGLQFILYYYYTGVPSWAWYYPYYYSPMIMDIIFILKELSKQEGYESIEQSFEIKFEQCDP